MSPVINRQENPLAISPSQQPTISSPTTQKLHPTNKKTQQDGRKVNMALMAPSEYTNRVWPVCLWHAGSRIFRRNTILPDFKANRDDLDLFLKTRLLPRNILTLLCSCQESLTVGAWCCMYRVCGKTVNQLHKAFVVFWWQRQLSPAILATCKPNQ